MNKQQLAAKIWESANKMRSKIEANEYKDYILGFIFYKFLSETEIARLRAEDWGAEDLKGLDENDAETVQYVRDLCGYFISYNNLFSTWIASQGDFTIADVRDALSAFERNIDPARKRVFVGIFATLQTGLSKLGTDEKSRSKAVRDLIYLIKDIPMDSRQDYDTLGSQVQKINQLTVIASDGYKDFVADLQKGIREDLYDRPTKATAEYFIGKTLNIGGSDVTVSDKQGRDIYRYLIKNDYIDEDDHVTDKYRADLANDALAPVPESCKEITDGVHALIQSIFDEHALDDMISDGHETKIQENALNDNFYKKEFQTLWNYINHKYAYTVEFDSDELIRKAIAHIDDKMFVAKLQYTVTTGQQQDDMNSDALKNGASFIAEKSKTYTLERAEGSAVKYDLVGKIAEGAKLTRRSAAKILAGIRPYTFAMFKNNPEEFITKAIRLINEQKATMIVEQITYNQTDGTYDSSIFTAEKNTDFSKAYHAKKNVQDYVFADGYAKDGQSIERQFAESMDLADEVCVYAKLPKGFSIPTPVGNYSPDWAIAFNKGTVKHIFFIAETKGTMDSLNLKPIEQSKIACAKKLFSNLSSADVVYHEVNSYQHLLDIMDKL